MVPSLRFLFSHAVFVSSCAAALTFETCILAACAPGLSVLLVFFSTLAAYNFYILVCSYTEGGKFVWNRNGSHALIILLSVIPVSYCLFRLPECLPYMLAASVLTLLYVLPRSRMLPRSSLLNKGYLKTLLLASTWTGVTLFVPVAGQSPHALSVAIALIPLRFCFMLILCIIFDSRDVSLDAIKGLNSLATDVSSRQLNIIIHGVFVLYVVSAAFMPGSPVKVAYWSTGAVSYFLFRLSLKKQGYYFY